MKLEKFTFRKLIAVLSSCVGALLSTSVFASTDVMDVGTDFFFKISHWDVNQIVNIIVELLPVLLVFFQAISYETYL